jgi:membrane protein
MRSSKSPGIDSGPLRPSSGSADGARFRPRAEAPEVPARLHGAVDRLPRALRDPVWLAIRAGQRWIEADASQLGAAIAFYTIFSLAPILVITVAVAGAVIDADVVRGQIVHEIEALVGAEAAVAINDLIQSGWHIESGLLAFGLGVVTLLFGATGVFAQLRSALNEIGRIAPDRSAVGAFVRVRLVSIALVLGCGFLALASLVLSAAVSATTDQLARIIPAGDLVARFVDLVVSTAVLTVAFAALLRWLPDRSPSARGSWFAALVSAVLFSIGRYAIGLYLGRVSIRSAYGAAGSFVIIILWVYYSAQILLYGAALGRVYDDSRGAGTHDAPPLPQRASMPTGGGRETASTTISAVSNSGSTAGVREPPP